MKLTKNVVLTGFMGTGKTSTGKALAARLGCGFIDLDQYIEEKERRTIPQIFASRGEAYFRAAEKKAVQEVMAQQGLVVATGGGTILDFDNRRALRRNGVVICLTADLDTVVARTKHRGERPLLDGDDDDRRRAAAALWEKRRPLYAEADHTVDTTALSPLQITDNICHFLRREGILHG